MFVCQSPPSAGESKKRKEAYRNDKRIVESLFEGCAFKVPLASRDVAWELNTTAYMVIVMSTQFFEGREHRYVDYPLSEVLQMLGKTSRPAEDKFGKAVLMTTAVKKDYYRKFFNEALPIESHLPAYQHDSFVTEISTKTIGSTQDAVDWPTYTYFYRRLLANPSYYSLTDTFHEGLSTHLSEMVENTLKDLAEAKIVDIDEEDDTVTPFNAARILEIVTSATDFESIQIHRHEDRVLRRIYDNVPVKMSQPNYESPHFKAFVLLQAQNAATRGPSS
ncbi:hypothetical protein B9Z19DRAFT_1130522 [Tuber borchii]|uniref:Uncharacterized protein n=1 Tax=Tuber borchii TaxID=42251 RepID=A0A2T6ZK91_TUBBO|nr:hypothetical protein B9Z19DRAFT_1130522 [Tuber borchii]